jgi:hypothetical protein
MIRMTETVCTSVEPVQLGGLVGRFHRTGGTWLCSLCEPESGSVAAHGWGASPESALADMQRRARARIGQMEAALAVLDCESDATALAARGVL